MNARSIIAARVGSFTYEAMPDQLLAALRSAANAEPGDTITIGPDGTLGRLEQDGESTNKFKPGDRLVSLGSFIANRQAPPMGELVTVQKKDKCWIWLVDWEDCWHESCFELVAPGRPPKDHRDEQKDGEV